MAFGRPAPDTELPLNTRVNQIYERLAKCNNVAEVGDLLSKIADDELVGLRVAYSVARPGRSARELAFLHGVRAAIAAEIHSRRLDEPVEQESELVK
jgi:hypothetical protein